MLAGLKDRASFGIAGIVQLVLRFFQFVLAITVAGLYGVDLHHASQAHAYTDGKWVFAEVVAGLSAVSVFIYFIHFRWLFIWDFVIFILWTALFGVFGKIYIHAHPTPKQSGQIRMKHAVWVDLANMLLWLITFLMLGSMALMGRDRKTLHTGRANV
ncbi:hypothetical protein MBLNU459_g0777t1 [Dothideomycetes sp. NU459]